MAIESYDEAVKLHGSRLRITRGPLVGTYVRLQAMAHDAGEVMFDRNGQTERVWIAYTDLETLEPLR